MQRRTFLKTLALVAAAVTTPALTPVEAEEAAKIPAPKPLFGTRAYVSTFKGPTGIVRHGLNRPNVFVRAINLKGQTRSPRVDPIDRDAVRLTFEEPWSITGRRKIYKIVIFC